MGFKRTIENFVCQHCGVSVCGNGYTNHCPNCLWSKHVDVHPGDRAEACGGMMRPIAVQGSTPRYRVVHRCERCGMERINDVQEEDRPEALIALSEHRDPA